ncbi:PREDICTED: uncharacterized protein LOC107080733, partial [Cyprinodon variegatus]|uniref:uncharacterized protein LOC107080733 n=1 Tax=Cyprinodon variegatus TaxID=28743 RepID=UPI000742A365
MTPLRFICLVTYLILETVAYLDVQGPSPSLQFKAVNIGLNITLKCLYKESDGVIFYWYKQTLGQKPKLISEFYKYKRNSSLKGEFWKDQRFDLETGTDKNNLKILNVQMSDSATYYCTGIHSYEYKFLEGIILHFNTSVMVYVLSGTLAFVTMLAFFLAIILYKKSCKEPPQRSSPASSLQANVYEHADDLHYAALSLSGARGSR